MKASLIALDYQGFPVSFNEDGWFNATAAAAHYGKQPNDWIEQAETAEYIAALLEVQLPGRPVVKEIQALIQERIGRSAHNQLLRLVKKSGLVKTRPGAPGTGGGTWLHPKLAVPFARWLDVRFAVWCDLQIDRLIQRQHPHFDWKLKRRTGGRLSAEQREWLAYLNGVGYVARRCDGWDAAREQIIAYLIGHKKPAD